VQRRERSGGTLRSEAGLVGVLGEGGGEGGSARANVVVHVGGRVLNMQDGAAGADGGGGGFGVGGEGSRVELPGGAVERACGVGDVRGVVGVLIDGDPCGDRMEVGSEERCADGFGGDARVPQLGLMARHDDGLIGGQAQGEPSVLGDGRQRARAAGPAFGWRRDCQRGGHGAI
jgi:hypothetical protein